jgi:predicted lactoylglutathione lyase
MTYFPPAVPEIPVRDIDKAAEYYVTKLGFTLDWGGEDGGIAGISRGESRVFLTNPSFREFHGNSSPVLIWFNVNSKEEVNQLYEQWKGNEATIVSAPESKPWKLHEFTAKDLDGNLFRVFYDFSRDV